MAGGEGEGRRGAADGLARDTGSWATLLRRTHWTRARMCWRASALQTAHQQHVPATARCTSRSCGRADWRRRGLAACRTPTRSSRTASSRCRPTVRRRRRAPSGCPSASLRFARWRGRSGDSSGGGGPYDGPADGAGRAGTGPDGHPRGDHRPEPLGTRCASDVADDAVGTASGSH